MADEQSERKGGKKGKHKRNANKTQSSQSVDINIRCVFAIVEIFFAIVYSTDYTFYTLCASALSGLAVSVDMCFCVYVFLF